ncbi:MAG: minor capsid protein [Ruthenibacterium sp.]
MANHSLKVETPRGCVVTNAGKGGKVTARLEWAADFGARKTQDFETAQKFVDSEVLRLSAPYIPFQTGMLKKSGILGTVIGSGEVNWIAPYAAAQYWGTAISRGYNALCGGMWFERMKADHLKEIITGAKRKAGGK